MAPFIRPIELKVDRGYYRVNCVAPQFFFVVVCFSFFICADAEFWQNSARNYLRKVLAMNADTSKSGIARNVILFVGDGMGMSTITAGRMFKGQLQGRAGEEEQLSFEMFPNVGLAKVSERLMHS